MSTLYLKITVYKMSVMIVIVDRWISEISVYVITSQLYLYITETTDRYCAM